MNKFSNQSLIRLDSADERLQVIFTKVLHIIDCTIIEGHRDKELQNEYFRTGKSKVEYPNGKHNEIPSMAVDVAPYPINWNDKKRFYYFAGIVKAVAFEMGYKLRWGGDWDNDNDLNDQTFMDLVHFELIGNIHA